MLKVSVNKEIKNYNGLFVTVTLRQKYFKVIILPDLGGIMPVPQTFQQQLWIHFDLGLVANGEMNMSSTRFKEWQWKEFSHNGKT